MFGRHPANFVRDDLYDGDDVAAFAASFRMMVAGRRFDPVAVIAPETGTRRTLLRRSVPIAPSFQAWLHLPGDAGGFGLSLLVNADESPTQSQLATVHAAAQPWFVDTETFAPGLFVNPEDVTQVAPEAVGQRVFATLTAVGGRPPTGRWVANWQCSRNIWK